MMMMMMIVLVKSINLDLLGFGQATRAVRGLPHLRAVFMVLFMLTHYSTALYQRGYQQLVVKFWFRLLPSANDTANWGGLANASITLDIAIFNLAK